MPHLKDRPFTLKRYPNGVLGQRFYEKQCPHHREKWVRTAWFGGTNYCLLNDLPTLIWAANLASIELHTTLATIVDMNSPNMLVLDLDPGDGVGIDACLEVAILARASLSRMRLEALAKTSGQKGLHLYLPLNSGVSFETGREFARKLAEDLELTRPDLITSKMPKKYRAGKVYIDWHQNVDFKTTVTVYSLRANNRPTVSTPVTWAEIEHAHRSPGRARELLTFETPDVIRRIGKYGDLFSPVLTLVQKLPEMTVRKTRVAA